MNYKKQEFEEIYNYLKKYKECCYVNEIYYLIKSEKMQCKNYRIQDLIVAMFIFIASIIVTAVILIYNLVFEKKYNYNEKIAIARVPSEKYKIYNVYKDMQFVEDDIKHFDFTIYRIGCRYKRILFLLTTYIKKCIQDFMQVIRIVEPDEFNQYRAVIIRECAKRIPHTIVHKNAIEYILKNYKLDNIYTGATYERFALIATSLSKKYKKTLICIPHGVETTDKLPAGYAGDIFYASSQEMACKLNQIYETSIFIFDNDITQKMYRGYSNHEESKLKKERKVVFFTQPTNKASLEKIIEDVANHMRLKERKLYIRTHPNENNSEYSIENTEFVDDFEEAISNSICISLFSTVLLEAIYNDSMPISIIHLLESRVELDGSYEFLNDKRILKPESISELLNEIDILINN